MARHLFYPGDAPRGINSLGRDYACVLLKQCRTHLGIQLDARCTLDSPPYRGPAFHQLATLSSIFLSLFAPPFLSLFSSHSRRLSLSFSLFLRLPLSFWILQKLSSYQRSRITSRVALVAMISNVGGT